jgi:DTW domain-containing protein
VCQNHKIEAQTLPRLVLEDLPAEQYTIRKAQKPYQLSTLEAASIALARLEVNPSKYEPLNDAFLAFNVMVTEQIKLRTV